MTDNARTWVTENWLSLAAILLSLSATVYSFGMRSQALNTLETQFEKMNAEGTDKQRETRWIVEVHSKDIAELKADARKANESINDLKTDMKIVVEWVKEQKQKDHARP